MRQSLAHVLWVKYCAWAQAVTACSCLWKFPAKLYNGMHRSRNNPGAFFLETRRVYFYQTKTLGSIYWRSAFQFTWYECFYYQKDLDHITITLSISLFVIPMKRPITPRRQHKRMKAEITGGVNLRPEFFSIRRRCVGLMVFSYTLYTLATTSTTQHLTPRRVGIFPVQVFRLRSWCEWCKKLT